MEVGSCSVTARGRLGAARWRLGAAPSPLGGGWELLGEAGSCPGRLGAASSPRRQHQGAAPPHAEELGSSQRRGRHPLQLATPPVRPVRPGAQLHQGVDRTWNGPLTVNGAGDSWLKYSRPNTKIQQEVGGQTCNEQLPDGKLS